MNEKEIDLVDGMAAFHATLKAKNDFLAFVRAERERAVQEQAFEKWSYHKGRLEGRVQQCDTIIAWLEGENDKQE